MIIKSRYLVPVDGPVIENGAILVRDRRIAVVDSARNLSAPRNREVIDYENAIICPGLVNAHTHLELSFLAGQVRPTPDFIGWLRRMNAILNSRTRGSGQVQEAVREGVSQSLSAGVTAFGDITRAPQWSRRVLGESLLGGVSFGEVIAVGRRRGQLEERLDAAAAPTESDSLRSGISPHAPYSVEPEALRACARRARKLNALLCIHLAETPDEDQFTRYARGRFADFLRELGAWDRHIHPSGCGPVELAARTGVLGRSTIIAHANYVSDADISLIADSGASVAFCPRTHKAFEHPPHRFREMLAARINVCVGTDSLASNPSLSVLAELRFLKRQYPDMPADKLLAMGTLHGARALGLDDTIGSITVGKRADLVVLPLADTPQADRWETIIESNSAPIAVYAAGKRVA